MLSGLAALARPRHWIKNVFVLMPLPFAVAAGATLLPARFLSGLVGICLASSAVYALNDSMDVERDRRHPDKRERPVAAGRVSVAAARVWAAALFAGGAVLAWWGGGRAALDIVLAYVVLNLVYSLRGRQIPLVDVFLLSSGYVLRVLLGCALLAVSASSWLLLCSSTLALFLALAKRRSDLVRGVDDSHRPSLAGYSERFLEQAMSVTLGMALIAYALYCMEAEVLVPGREFASLPFAVFGVLEYLRQVHVRGEGGSPVDLLLSSPLLLLCGFGWGLAALWSVGLFW
jgi:4-hydroxybenzoate polyprenyltransferase